MAREGDPRTGRRWQQVIADCKATYGYTCHMCGLGIPDRPHSPWEPMSYEVDHLIPVSQRPDLAYDLANCRPSHRRCNRFRSGRPLTIALVQEIRVRFTPPRRPALDWFDVSGQ